MQFRNTRRWDQVMTSTTHVVEGDAAWGTLKNARNV